MHNNDRKFLEWEELLQNNSSIGPNETLLYTAKKLYAIFKAMGVPPKMVHFMEFVDNDENKEKEIWLEWFHGTKPNLTVCANGEIKGFISSDIHNPETDVDFSIKFENW